MVELDEWYEMEHPRKIRDDDMDIYEETNLEQMSEDGQLSPEEAAFMMGYEEAG